MPSRLWLPCLEGWASPDTSLPTSSEPQGLFQQGRWSKSGCVVQAKGVSWAKAVGGRAGDLVGAVRNSPWGR